MNANEPIEIKVTNINGVYHARLFYNGEVMNEMSCKRKQDISWICGEMMRWFDKSSGIYNRYADKARDRHNEKRLYTPTGVKYRIQIEEEKNIVAKLK